MKHPLLKAFKNKLVPCELKQVIEASLVANGVPQPTPAPASQKLTPMEHWRPFYDPHCVHYCFRIYNIDATTVFHIPIKIGLHSMQMTGRKKIDSNNVPFFCFSVSKHTYVGDITFIGQIDSHTQVHNFKVSTAHSRNITEDIVLFNVALDLVADTTQKDKKQCAQIRLCIKLPDDILHQSDYLDRIKLALSQYERGEIFKAIDAVEAACKCRLPDHAASHHLSYIAQMIFSKSPNTASEYIRTANKNLFFKKINDMLTCAGCQERAVAVNNDSYGRRNSTRRRLANKIQQRSAKDEETRNSLSYCVNQVTNKAAAMTTLKLCPCADVSSDCYKCLCCFFFNCRAVYDIDAKKSTLPEPHIFQSVQDPVLQELVWECSLDALCRGDTCMVHHDGEEAEDEDDDEEEDEDDVEEGEDEDEEDVEGEDSASEYESTEDDDQTSCSFISDDEDEETKRIMEKQAFTIMRRITKVSRAVRRPTTLFPSTKTKDACIGTEDFVPESTDKTTQVNLDRIPNEKRLVRLKAVHNDEKKQLQAQLAAKEAENKELREQVRKLHERRLLEAEADALKEVCDSNNQTFNDLRRNVRRQKDAFDKEVAKQRTQLADFQKTLHRVRSERDKALKEKDIEIRKESIRATDAEVRQIEAICAYGVATLKEARDVACRHAQALDDRVCSIPPLTDGEMRQAITQAKQWRAWAEEVNALIVSTCEEQQGYTKRLRAGATLASMEEYIVPSLPELPKTRNPAIFRDTLRYLDINTTFFSDDPCQLNLTKPGDKYAFMPPFVLPRHFFRPPSDECGPTMMFTGGGDGGGASSQDMYMSPPTSVSPSSSSAS